MEHDERSFKQKPYLSKTGKVSLLGSIFQNRLSNFLNEFAIGGCGHPKGEDRLSVVRFRGSIVQLLDTTVRRYGGGNGLQLRATGWFRFQ